MVIARSYHTSFSKAVHQKWKLRKIVEFISFLGIIVYHIKQTLARGNPWFRNLLFADSNIKYFIVFCVLIGLLDQIKQSFFQNLSSFRCNQSWKASFFYVLLRSKAWKIDFIFGKKVDLFNFWASCTNCLSHSFRFQILRFFCTIILNLETLQNDYQGELYLRRF